MTHDHIIKLNITQLVKGTVTLFANGHVVYEGPLDNAILERWQYYFKHETPIPLIKKLEQEWSIWKESHK